MLKLLTALLSISLITSVTAATINPYQKQGCRYDGATGKDGKPEGKGALVCNNGTSYEGNFKQGRFHGNGIYHVATKNEIFLEPFNVDSTKLNNMSLKGVFKNGYADGRFTAIQNGQPVFIIKYQKGMMIDVSLPKTK